MFLQALSLGEENENNQYDRNGGAMVNGGGTTAVPASARATAARFPFLH
jgi:hypothetical protein